MLVQLLGVALTLVLWLGYKRLELKSAPEAILGFLDLLVLPASVVALGSVVDT